MEENKLGFLFGAGRIEPVLGTDSWRVVGGWADGATFTAAEVRDARQSEKAFAEFLQKKREELLLAQMQKDGNYRPNDYFRVNTQRWPGSGGLKVDVTADPVRQRRLAPSLADDFKQTDGTYGSIQRSTTPMFKPSPRQGEFIEGTMRVAVRIPTKSFRLEGKKKVEHEEPPVLRRKYRKEK